MNLINIKNGEIIDGKISKVGKSELLKLKRSAKFQFDWSLERANEVYSIRNVGNDELLGLISLIDVAEEFRIHINLIESSIKHQGKDKEIDGIPGCLIGFTCEMSFKKGYDGFVSLTPKTRLAKHYHEKFGFLHMGINMFVFEETSHAIIQKYLKNE